MARWRCFCTRPASRSKIQAEIELLCTSKRPHLACNTSMITPPLTCDPGRADRVNLPRVFSPHGEATVRCAKARPGSNSSTGSPAPVRYRGCKTARVRSARRVRNNRFNVEDKGQWEMRLRAVDFPCVSPAQAPVKPSCSSHCRAHNRDSLDSIRPPSGVTRGCLAVAAEIECYPAGDFVRTRKVATFAHGAGCGNWKTRA